MATVSVDVEGEIPPCRAGPAGVSASQILKENGQTVMFVLSLL